jgi:HK97 family phage major capsid protein
MPYDSIITGDELSVALNRPEYSNEIFQSAIANSAVMALARRLPNMGAGVRNLPIMSAMPLAYFVGATQGVPNKKQTASLEWKNKALTAEEIAVIVPIPEAVLADAAINLQAEIIPRVGEAVGRTLDAAVLGGTNLPASWLTTTAGVSQSIVAGAIATGNDVADTLGEDLYDAIAGADGVFAQVEQDGYMVSGTLMHPVMMGRLRGVRETATGGVGMPIFARTLDGNYSLMGERALFQRNGAASLENPLIAGDWSQIVWAVRQDLTVKLLTEGVIQDAEGDIVYNLAQQDMVALRVVFRAGVQIANPVNSENTDEATRYPFAVLTSEIAS